MGKDPPAAAAVTLVQDILDQITANDAPAINEGVLSTPQQHNDDSGTSRSSPTSDEGSLEDAAVAAAARASNLTHAMGHGDFANLCISTLAQVGLSSSSSKMSLVLPPLQIETTATLRSSTPRKKFGLSFRKQIGSPKADTLEEKKEDIAPAPATPTSRRLQMFGSEYARYLSTSQLAPVVAAKMTSPVKQHRRMVPKHSRRRRLDDAPMDIQTGALLDIVVTLGDDPPPSGYYRISSSQASTTMPYSLNVKKEALWDKAAQRPCVTALTVIYPDRLEFVPPGFSVVRVGRQQQQQGGPPANLNAGSNDERVFLCFRRSREGNPITGLRYLSPPESIPAGYTVVERTPRNHVAHFGGTTFLAYRQRLANLETMRPAPLVRSVHRYTGAVSQLTATERKSNRRILLESYYATGGSIVDSDIGRFHIMDRTTHSLLSPSSVANRLSLIESSRQRSNSGDVLPSTNYATTYARSDTGSDASTFSSFTNNNVRHSGSLKDQPIQEHVELHSACSSAVDGEAPLDQNANLSSLLVAPEQSLEVNDEERRNCRLAMDFIPAIETVHNDDTLELRVALLTPILTACYTRHGGAGLIAAQGLVSLLAANFYQNDVGDNESSSTRITLLDLSIQTVCDMATSSSQESIFASCVDFVDRAVQFANGQLNTRTIGYVLRFYLFVFYFDASIPRASCVWPLPSWRPLDMAQEEDFPVLYDPREDNHGSYFPGGAPQAAALALKDLISLSIVRLGKISVTGLFSTVATTREEKTLLHQEMAVRDAYAPVLDGILDNLVDKAVGYVERANYTQLALHQIHRSGGSELFWHDMVHACGEGLFRDDSLSESGKEVHITVFALLEQFVKVASGKLQPAAAQADLMPKDVASKLMSLELLLHFLEFWSDEQEAVGSMEPSTDGHEDSRSIHTLAFVVRRTVVPCLLWNTKAALENAQVFRRVIRIISELWCSPVYRKYCKVELGVLMEHFALRMIELGPQCLPSRLVKPDEPYLLSQQIELIGEIKNWFSNDPKDVIELYLNFDTDISAGVTGPIQLLPGTRWQIFQRLCAGLSSMAEQCGELIGNQIKQNQSIFLTAKREEHSVGDEAKKDWREKAETREAAKALRKVSLEAISQIVQALAVSAAAASGSSFVSLLLSWTPSAETPIAYQNTFSPKRRHNTAEPTSPDSSKKPIQAGGEGVLKYWRNQIVADQKLRSEASAPTSRDSYETAFGIAKQKSLKKAVEYLIACNTLTPSPRDIANFLRINKDQFDQSDLGVYLSESGTGGAETEYWNSVRHLFVRANSFIGMTVEEALRQFLTCSGFRLPGEAQRIDRLMDSFAQCYFEDNAGDVQRCPFKDQDTVYLIVFAVIMLNTDLHKAKGGTQSRKAPKKMTKTEFIHNLRGATQNESVSKDYLSKIYDSVDAKAIVMFSDDSATDDNQTSRRTQASVAQILENVRGSDSMLRGLAVHDFTFSTIDDFRSNLFSGLDAALSDLTCSCVAKTWHQWHGVVNTCLETAHLDPQGMEAAVDILLYALAVTVCLNLPMERSAFLSQLVRLRAFEERRQGKWVGSAPEQQWLLELETACSGLTETKLGVLRKIHAWVQTLKVALRSNVQNKAEMTDAVKLLVHGEFLLQDPARSFLQAGNLTKQSRRTGRCTEYRFYLFSDVLLYASPESDGRFKIHEELPLHLMKIVDWFPVTVKQRNLLFQVHHPRKSFLVQCPSPEARREWVADIRATILVEMERKMTMEAARAATTTVSRV